MTAAIVIAVVIAASALFLGYTLGEDIAGVRKELSELTAAIGKSRKR